MVNLTIGISPSFLLPTLAMLDNEPHPEQNQCSGRAMLIFHRETNELLPPSTASAVYLLA
ncbi:hypothetical protein [Paenibacillus sp. LHD-38]|uniref:hypothetical protein n=1 Tax=Paenibacillus sp. LHD-38 TaxID=3072143 RepID=UPI00280E96B1|nr:hypothetical protein [Paenibacillus sp. LHD-38]MDQ8738294.1 hypothetical protein [Paenibacillus sp. LHD-38]